LTRLTSGVKNKLDKCIQIPACENFPARYIESGKTIEKPGAEQGIVMKLDNEI